MRDYSTFVLYFCNNSLVHYQRCVILIIYFSKDLVQGLKVTMHIMTQVAFKLG